MKSLLVQIVFIITLTLSGALAQSNNDAKKLYNDGNAKMKAGDYAGAIVKYHEALTIEKHQYYYYQLGLAFRKSGRNEDAVKAYEDAITLDPKFSTAFHALGGAYFAMKEYQKSIDSYQKALAESPTLGQSKRGLAAAQAARAAELVASGSSDQAVELTKQAVMNDPNLNQAFVIMAQAYNKEGKYADAIDAAENAIKATRSGRKGAAFFELGLAYRNSGNATKAREAFIEARKDPTYSRNADYELKQLPK